MFSLSLFVHKAHFIWTHFSSFIQSFIHWDVCVLQVENRDLLLWGGVKWRQAVCPIIHSDLHQLTVLSVFCSGCRSSFFTADVDHLIISCRRPSWQGGGTAVGSVMFPVFSCQISALMSMKQRSNHTLLPLLTCEASLGLEPESTIGMMSLWAGCVL